MLLHLKTPLKTMHKALLHFFFDGFLKKVITKLLEVLILSPLDRLCSLVSSHAVHLSTTSITPVIKLTAVCLFSSQRPLYLIGQCENRATMSPDVFRRAPFSKLHSCDESTHSKVRAADSTVSQMTFLFETFLFQHHHSISSRTRFCETFCCSTICTRRFHLEDLAFSWKEVSHYY